jgi:ribose transport system ATP-binding protein
VDKVKMEEIINAMVGRQIGDIHRKMAKGERKEALRVEDLCTDELKHITFSAYKGEILGIAGLVGAGRSELARAIFGADPFQQGQVFINGSPVTIRSPRDAVNNGIGLLPEDRKSQGLVLTSSLETNIALGVYDRISRFTIVKTKARQKLALQYVDSLKIRPPAIERLVRFLSGGNQQKVVLGKWLARNVDIIIFDEPTRGIDVGTKSEVHHLMIDLAEAGACVIMISSELPEIFQVSDRIMVMREGRIAADIECDQASQEIVMEFATGIRAPMEVI